jgi:hypothetical protein
MSKTTPGLLLALLALTQPTCEQAPMTAPAGSTLTIFANPTFIVANGGVSVISALVVEPAGTTVPDGTVVMFFSTLGQIEPQGQTKQGVARVNLVADSRSGTAQVTATTGDQTATIDGGVAIGSALPSLVVVTADPPAIRSNQWSAITANVFDADGNPVAHVPVILSVEGVGLPGGGVGDVGESLDSGGAQLFTDTNGQVFDTLRSRRPLSDSADVTVTATTANGTTGSTSVSIN